MTYLLIPKAISHVEGSTGRIIIAGIPAEVDLQEGIEDLCRKYCIEFGVLVSAIGSLKKVNFDEGKIVYENPVALISAQGYITRTNSEEIFIHIHCNTRAPAFASAEDQILIAGNLYTGNPVLYQVEVVILEVKGVKVSNKGSFIKAN